MKNKVKSNYTDTIIDKFNQILNTILSIKYNYNLEDLFNNEKSINKNIMFEELINHYLYEIKENINNEQIIKNKSLIDSTSDFFDYTYDSKSEDKETINLYAIENEAEVVIDDLISKILGENGRTIELPVNIEDIIQYNINGMINKQDIEKVLMWVCMKLSIVCHICKKKELKA